MLVTLDNVPDEWRWGPYFHPREFLCLHCSILKINDSFMDRLFAIRAALGLPMVITSGYRCPYHNKEISESGTTGPHTTGHAADVQMAGEGVAHLLGIAGSQMTGFGLKQHGPTKERFVHLDDLQLPYHRPRWWTYA